MVDFWRQVHLGLPQGIPAGIRRGDPLPFNESAMWVKPIGGFWTSSHLGPILISDWYQLVRRERTLQARLERPLWLLEVDPDALVLHLTHPHDWIDLARAYPGPRGTSVGGRSYMDGINWIAIRDDGWDAVHMTRPVADAFVKEPWADYPTTFGWDVESTCWFRWAFTSVTPLARPRIAPDVTDEEARRRMLGAAW